MGRTTNVWNLFEVNNRDNRTTDVVLVSLLHLNRKIVHFWSTHLLEQTPLKYSVLDKKKKRELNSAENK